MSKDHPRDGFVGWYMKARQAGHPLISLGRPFHVYLYIDEPSRSSRCQICTGMIRKGERRAVLVAKYGYFRTFRGGGGATAEKFFSHASCWVAFMETEIPPTVDTKASCFDCERPFEGEFDYERRIWHSHTDFYLCQSCWDSPRWRQCDLCERMLRRSATSPIIGYPGWWGPRDELAPLQYSCVGCAENDGVTTARIARQQERADALFNERYQRIMLSVERGDLFDEG